MLDGVLTASLRAATSLLGPFGDHTSCMEANNPHVNHPITRRLHRT